MIDAIDNIEEEELDRFLLNIKILVKDSSARVMMTSRRIQRICESFTDRATIITLEIRASDDDLRAFVNHELHARHQLRDLVWEGTKFNPDFANQIVHAVQQRAQGM